MSMMDKMMEEMMPKMMEGVDMMEMILPIMTNENRMDFVLKTATILMGQGCVGMSEEEKKEFVAQVEEKVKAC